MRRCCGGWRHRCDERLGCLSDRVAAKTADLEAQTETAKKDAMDYAREIAEHVQKELNESEAELKQQILANMNAAKDKFGAFGKRMATSQILAAQRLKTLRTDQKSQSSFLQQITQIGDLNDELRSAANNNDIITVKKLMKQGVACNIPDETGFSAFKYACGQGNSEIIEIMLENAEL